MITTKRRTAITSPLPTLMTSWQSHGPTCVVRKFCFTARTFPLPPPPPPLPHALRPTDALVFK